MKRLRSKIRTQWSTHRRNHWHIICLNGLSILWNISALTLVATHKTRSLFHCRLENDIPIGLRWHPTLLTLTMGALLTILTTQRAGEIDSHSPHDEVTCQVTRPILSSSGHRCKLRNENLVSFIKWNLSVLSVTGHTWCLLSEASHDLRDLLALWYPFDPWTPIRHSLWPPDLPTKDSYWGPLKRYQLIVRVV